MEVKSWRCSSLSITKAPWGPDPAEWVTESSSRRFETQRAGTACLEGRRQGDVGWRPSWRVKQGPEPLSRTWWEQSQGFNQRRSMVRCAFHKGLVESILPDNWVYGAGNKKPWCLSSFNITHGLLFIYFWYVVWSGIARLYVKCMFNVAKENETVF